MAACTEGLKLRRLGRVSVHGVPDSRSLGAELLNEGAAEPHLQVVESGKTNLSRPRFPAPYTLDSQTLVLLDRKRLATSGCLNPGSEQLFCHVTRSVF